MLDGDWSSDVCSSDLSRFLSNDMVLEAFVREIRDNGRFNKLVEAILTKEKKVQIKDISSLIKTLV
jgi:hypothetical protein